MKILRISFLLLFASICIKAQAPGTTALPNNAYNTGETLKYLAYYGFIDGGTASITLKESWVDGKLTHHAKAIAQTQGFVDMLYGLYDVYESYFDPASGLPYKDIIDLKEGPKYKRYNEVTYDHVNDYVVSQRKGKVKVKDNTFDIVSVFYYLRRKDLKNLKENDIVRYNTYFQDAPFDLVIRYVGKETINLSGVGKVECLKFKPMVETGKTFEDEEAITVWISNDKNQIPMRVKIEFAVGSVKMDLIEYSGLKNPINTVK